MVHVQGVPELVRDGFSVGAEMVEQRTATAAEDLVIDPTQADGCERRTDFVVLRVIRPHWCFAVLAREDPIGRTRVRRN